MDTVVIALLFANILILSGLAVYSWLHRQVNGSRGFFWFTITVTCWVLAAALSAVSRTPEQAAFWMDKVRMVGVALSPVGLLGFALDYTAHLHWLTRKRLTLLLAVPAATLLVTWFFPESFMFNSAFVKSGPFLFYQNSTFGWWNWIHISFSYCVITISLLMIIRYAFLVQQYYRTRAFFLLAGGLAPLTASVLTTIGTIQGQFHDATALSFSLAGLLWAWALFRFQFITVNPVAHNLIIASMHDPIIVLNSHFQVIDFNPSASRLLNLTSEAIGKPAIKALAEHPGLLRLLDNPSSDTQETRLSSVSGQRYFDARLSPLIGEGQGKGKDNGLLIALRDITRLKTAQQAERDQRLLAEALHDTAAALNSTLATEDVIQRIFENVGRVVNHDASNIILIDEEMNITGLLRGGETDHNLATLQEVINVTSSGNVRDLPNFARMLETGKPVVVPNTLSHPDWVAVESHAWVRSYIGMPIHMRGRTIGFLNLDSATPDNYNETHIERLLPFTHQAAAALENASFFEEKNWLASHDPLTRLFNRRQFFDLAEIEVERAQRYHHHLSLIMIDADNFKLVNDAHGHLAGDRVLTEISRLCEQSIRKVDLAARYGGEEFVLLLPETTQERAYEIAERLRKAVASYRFQINESTTVSLTLSLGVTALSNDESGIESLVQRADEALYKAKAEGRNQTILC
jgi:diguanylate cyclase (GGDEF)-like protein